MTSGLGGSLRRHRSQLGLVALGLAAAPMLAEFRVGRSSRRPNQDWRLRPIQPRGRTELGISFRPLQAEALGLDPEVTLRALLAYPFHLVRLAAYWSRVETAPGRFDASELDRQMELAEGAGKRIILSVGAIKNFGYPEFFVPPHHLREPLAEHTLVSEASHPALSEAAVEQVRRVVERYRGRRSIIAWQVEHEAVDPLGVEHSWRLSRGVVAREVAAVRALDTYRPVLMNGFLSTTTPVGWMQRWRTRGQGDSLQLAQGLADIVGIDYYSRNAVLAWGSRSLYLTQRQALEQNRRWRKLAGWAARPRHRLIVSEGQAEPWEAETVPPDRPGMVAFSCPPERLIDNYNSCLRPAASGVHLEAYLFWGAEYWVQRQAGGDGSYLAAFARVLDES